MGWGELKKGEDFPYQQGDLGAGVGYQWKRFTKPHLENVDPDKESLLVAGVGYEYLRTIQSGKGQPGRPFRRTGDAALFARRQNSC